MATAPIEPIEERIALATGPSQTVSWTSLRYKGDARVAIVMPVAGGSAIDLTNDAWFEALEASTAPRIAPPEGTRPGCRDDDNVVVENTGEMGHRAGLVPTDFEVLDGVDAVKTWAAQRSMVSDPILYAALRDTGSLHFFVARFPAQSGGGLTGAIRTTGPVDAHLPLGLLRAGESALWITVFVLAPGRATAQNLTPFSEAGTLNWFPVEETSNYTSLRYDGLLDAGQGVTTESAGHTSLVRELPTILGGPSVDAFTPTYFERGAGYTFGAGDPDGCVARAVTAFEQAEPSPPFCAQGELGRVPPFVGCTPPSGSDANPMACGGDLDDLAVGLAGMPPIDTWLTRETLIVAANQLGPDVDFVFEGGDDVSAFRYADYNYMEECPPASNGDGGGSSSGHGHGSGVGVEGSGDIDLGSGDSCDGGSDDADNGCDGDADGGDGCDAGGGDDCDGGDVGEGCSGGAPDPDCSFGRPRPTGHRKVRASIWIMAAFLVVAPLRRRATLRRRARATQRARAARRALRP